MRNKKKNRILLLLVLLIAITIGFAALATTLKINGTANIGKNSWNIYWDNIANKKGVVPENNPEITAYNNVPKTLLTWEVDLDKPGDYFEFEVDAVNAGSLDAEITGIESKYDNTSVITTTNGVLIEDNTVIPSYIKYSVKYKESGAKPALGDKLSKASDLTSTPPVYTRKTYVIHVEYDKDAVTPAIVNNMDDEGESHTFTFEVTYGQATASSESTPDIEYVPQNPNNPQPGDIVKVKATDKSTQEFYIISSNASETVLLAKYNLLVGNVVSNWDVSGQVDSSVTDYNLQSNTATAYDSNNPSNYVGSIDFRPTAEGSYGFWMNSQGNQLLSKYTENGYISINLDGNGYPEKVGGDSTSSASYFINTDAQEDFPYVYDEDSTIYPYIQSYVNKLKADYNMPSTITGRLISWEEVQSVKNVEVSGTNIIYTGNQSYWTGSVKEHYHNIFVIMDGNGTFTTMYSENNNSYFGIRPVIVVPTSLLN